MLGIKQYLWFHSTLWSFFQLRCGPRRTWSGSRRNWCSGNWRRAENSRQISSPGPGSAPPSPDPVGPVRTVDLHSNRSQESCHVTSWQRSSLDVKTQYMYSLHLWVAYIYNLTVISNTCISKHSNKTIYQTTQLPQLPAASSVSHIRDELSYLSSRCPHCVPIF